MSCSVYYTAERNTPLTDTEKVSVNNIVEKYNSEYPFDEKAEDFCVYDSVPENNVIFEGATKLPDSDIELSFDVAMYWLECLTEITRLLHGCQWTVTLEDDEMEWDDTYGWGLPVY
ncbi:MAG: hypothetical protein NC177_05260 [Ruminococcus flavefaciens]|nr:hypothetical protein [Ruminococcus flavefaciens]